MAVSYKWVIVIAIVIEAILNCRSESYSNEWIIKTILPVEKLERVVSRYGFRVARHLIDDKFLLIHSNISRSSRRRVNWISKALIYEDQIEYVEQLVWRQRTLRSFVVDDEKWHKMWYINKHSQPSLNILDVWEDGYNGTGVTIAIVDDGVQHTHDDLKQRYNPGLSKDFYDNDNDPSPGIGQSHGTKCAGIALATKNKKCVIGVAFMATLVGHRMIGQYGTTQAGEISALKETNGIDILSNSWGGTDLSSYNGPSADVAKALETGCKEGRNGKGAIYVFAGGNGGSDDNCNCDGFVNNIHTIAINSISIDNQPPGYAEPCSAILASTYSGPGAPRDNICATDINNGCTESFTGTSASTPMAAGILALVLQANPNLTWRDVQEIVVRTSNSTGLIYGNFKANGVGRQVSDLFGYGMLDSKSLIKTGKTWKSLPEQHTCMAPVTGEKSENKNVKANKTPRNTGGTLYTDGCNQTSHCVNKLEHVQVTVTFQSSKRGAVSLILVSPKGTVSNMLTERSRDTVSSASHTWTYMSVQFWGEDPVGKWTLNMSLLNDWRQNGALISWRLTLYGTGDECSVKKPQENTTEAASTYNKFSSKEKTILGATIGGVGVIFIAIIAVGLIKKRPGLKINCEKNKSTESENNQAHSDKMTYM